MFSCIIKYFPTSPGHKKKILFTVLLRKIVEQHIADKETKKCCLILSRLWMCPGKENVEEKILPHILSTEKYLSTFPRRKKFCATFSRCKNVAQHLYHKMLLNIFNICCTTINEYKNVAQKFLNRKMLLNMFPNTKCCFESI